MLSCAGRSLTFYKTLPATVMQIAYHDIMGFEMVGGSQHWAIRWRIQVDGVYYSRWFNSHTDNYYGWRYARDLRCNVVLVQTSLACALASIP